LWDIAGHRARSGAALEASALAGIRVRVTAQRARRSAAQDLRILAAALALASNRAIGIRWTSDDRVLAPALAVAAHLAPTTLRTRDGLVSAGARSDALDTTQAALTTVARVGTRTRGASERLLARHGRVRRWRPRLSRGVARDARAMGLPIRRLHPDRVLLAATEQDDATRAQHEEAAHARNRTQTIAGESTRLAKRFTGRRAPDERERVAELARGDIHRIGERDEPSFVRDAAEVDSATGVRIDAWLELGRGAVPTEVVDRPRGTTTSEELPISRPHEVRPARMRTSCCPEPASTGGTTCTDRPDHERADVTSKRQDAPAAPTKARRQRAVSARPLRLTGVEPHSMIWLAI
jgi:hypothetical protein